MKRNCRLICHRLYDNETDHSQTRVYLNVKYENRGLNVVCVGELQNSMNVMTVLHEECKQLDANQKTPYERAAAADADRYRREVSMK